MTALVMMALQLATFRAGLAKDADVLQRAYTAMHPGLYRYNSPAQMQANFDRLRADWAKCETLKEAYVGLSQFTAKVKCGHTYPNFFNQREQVVQEVFSGQNRLPFYFRWLNGKMVVLKDFTASHRLPRGSEIESIDGFPCDRILKRLMTIARADGSNDDKRRAYLSVTGDDKFEAFDIYFPLMFPLPAGGFTIKVRGLGEVRTEALSMEDRVAAYKEAASGEPWKLQTNYKTACLTMPSWETWAMYDGKWDWSGYIQKCFAQLKHDKVENLIIDLRGNEGGSSVGDVIASYLVSRPLRVSNYCQYTRYSKIDAGLKPDLKTWDRSFDDLSSWTSPLQYLSAGRNRFYRMTRYEAKDGDLIQPQPERFAGRVYVLVDSSNSSATFEFENLVQTYRLGTLIGEPTGGNLRGINGGAFYFLYLPNSQMEVDLPLIGQFPMSPKPDRGLIPDVSVCPTRSEIAAGRDVVLERTMKLIGTGEIPSACSPSPRETSG